MDRDITIRRARPGDEATLARIQTESWKAAFRTILAEATLERLTGMEKATQMYRRLLETGKGNGYLLEIGGHPHCIAWWDSTREADMAGYAELICIHSLPDNWAKGFGSAMMARLLEDMTEAGFAAVMLWVFRDNRRAISFYEKWGFSPNGRHQEAFGAVELMLEKTLR